MDLVRKWVDRGKFSTISTNISTGCSWGLGLWPLLLLGGQVLIKKPVDVGNVDETSISELMVVIYGAYGRKLMESKKLMETLMESQLPITEQWVNAWVKVVFCCILVEYDNFGDGFAVTKRESIYYAFTNLKSS